jgi:hypothetical protein
MLEVDFYGRIAVQHPFSETEWEYHEQKEGRPDASVILVAYKYRIQRCQKINKFSNT